MLIYVNHDKDESFAAFGVVYTAISIYVVGSKPQAYKTRPKGNMGS